MDRCQTSALIRSAHLWLKCQSERFLLAGNWNQGCFSQQSGLFSFCKLTRDGLKCDMRRSDGTRVSFWAQYWPWLRISIQDNTSGWTSIMKNGFCLCFIHDQTQDLLWLRSVFIIFLTICHVFYMLLHIFLSFKGLVHSKMSILYLITRIKQPEAFIYR